MRAGRKKKRQKRKNASKKKDKDGKPVFDEKGNPVHEVVAHKKYQTSIDLSALKELEGTTASSFLDLANAVILIDKKPYDKEYLTLSKERKRDFRRLIEHYAVIDVIGKRKYYIKRVYSKEQREELNELEINSNKDKRR